MEEKLNLTQEWDKTFPKSKMMFRIPGQKAQDTLWNMPRPFVRIAFCYQ